MTTACGSRLCLQRDKASFYSIYPNRITTSLIGKQTAHIWLAVKRFNEAPRELHANYHFTYGAKDCSDMTGNGTFQLVSTGTPCKLSLHLWGNRLIRYDWQWNVSLRLHENSMQTITSLMGQQTTPIWLAIKRFTEAPREFHANYHFTYGATYCSDMTGNETFQWGSTGTPCKLPLHLWGNMYRYDWQWNVSMRLYGNSMETIVKSIYR